MSRSKRGRGSRRRLRSTGYLGQPNGGLDALLNPAAHEPGTARWRAEHGDKVSRTFCAALRAARSLALAEVGEHDARRQPIVAYSCELGDGPRAPAGPLHWHVGHHRPRLDARPYVMLVSQRTSTTPATK